MIKSEKKLKELALVLGKRNSLQINQAIRALREEEPFEGVIGLLTETYNGSVDRSVLKDISEFLNDLKDHSARHEIITEIRKPWNEDTISMLVSSCWQSGLDYSDYMEDMINVFLKGDYTTAIECMTVIESSVAESSRERKDDLIKKLRDSTGAWLNEKKGLTIELLTILEK